MEKRDTFHIFGKAVQTQEGITKKSSNALATTLSTCQVPGSKLAGGTSLLVASVLGKNLMKPKQQIRGSVKRKPSERRKEPNDHGPSSNGKGRAGFLALPPRSMSINGPHISLNSPFVGASMTYLFDKVASVTDCRSTGHFVLPKRKVEEHFPPINKPGGIWMKLLDNKGKEWSFEFCFWHSKDSRIYYFKKFYPFVQSENLVGGDTVFFSRLEPEGTLYMSVKDRVQKSSQLKQTKQTKALTGGHASKDRFKERDYSNGGVRYLANDWSPSLDDEVLPRQGRPAPISVDEASHRKRKRKSDFPRISLSHRPNLVVGEVPVVPREKKLPRRVRSLTPENFQHVDRVGGVLGSQSKRLRVNVEEYSEWKDIQDLLRPAPGVVPTVVTIDGNDFEEYEEPPVLIKRPCYNPTYGENRWVKCNDCGRWRRVPSDAFVPARWVCAENDRDLKRAYCGAPQELSNFEVHQLLGISSDAEGEEEHYDEGDEDEEGDQQPTVWSATRTLVDGFKKNSPVQPEIESCKSYTWDLQDLQSLHPGWETQELSFGLKQSCEPNEESPSLTGRSNFLVHGAEKDSEMSTDCYDFLGSAGAGKDHKMSTTKADSYEFLGSSSAEKVEQMDW